MEERLKRKFYEFVNGGVGGADMVWKGVFCEWGNGANV
jgi:hypothetical protein